VVSLPKDTYINELEDVIFEGLSTINEAVTDLFPNDSIINTVLMQSYKQLTPQEQASIVDQLGIDWFVKLSARLERRLRGLTD